MVHFLAALALSQAPVPAPYVLPVYDNYSDAELCAWAENLFATRGRQPFVLDALKRRDNVTGSCSDRTLVENWSIMDTQENLGTAGIGWAAEYDRDRSRVICAGQVSPYAAMVRRGWRIVTNYSFSDGAHLSFTLQC